MKILLAVDGSAHAEIATRLLASLCLPSRTELGILTVVPEHTFLGGITLRKLNDAPTKNRVQQQKAIELLREIAQKVNTRHLKTESWVRWGNPAEEILKVSDEIGASLIILGAKGLTDQRTFRLGSVAQTMLKHARASILLARGRPDSDGQLTANIKETGTIKRALLATDGSRHSDMVANLLLDLALPRQSEVIVITALQSHITAWVKTPTLDFQTNQQLLIELQAAEENEARKITAEVEKRYQAKGYRTASLVIKGGAAESVLAASKKYKPDIIALGSRGLGGIESLLLGSVAERVARYAECSVLIGRSPR
ncbi:MAG: universal stress protein [Dehalococcoidales bacterium]|nr:universal stress protein [Dehalococcoidales bacterium]